MLSILDFSVFGSFILKPCVLSSTYMIGPIFICGFAIVVCV